MWILPRRLITQTPIIPILMATSLLVIFTCPLEGIKSQHPLLALYPRSSLRTISISNSPKPFSVIKWSNAVPQPKEVQAPLRTKSSQDCYFFQWTNNTGTPPKPSGWINDHLECCRFRASSPHLPTPWYNLQIRRSLLAFVALTLVISGLTAAAQISPMKGLFLPYG